MFFQLCSLFELLNPNIAMIKTVLFLFFLLQQPTSSRRLIVSEHQLNVRFYLSHYSVLLLESYPATSMEVESVAGN